MGSSEKFCLRWNDFENNISGAFRELREDKDFFDVTLACDDEQLQAHKVILSACSPFFKSILRRNRHEHPLLYLKGVKYTDLLSVLNFMYHGEVNVAQEELNSFLAVAEDLKVKGLTQNNANAADTKPHNSFRPETAKPRMREQVEKTEQQTLPKKPRPAPPPVPRVTPATYHDDVDIQEVVPVKTEPVSLPAETPPPTFHSIPHVTVQEDYSAAHLGEMGSGVVADPNMEYGDDYGDYEGYDGMDASYDGGILDTSGLAVGAQDGNKDETETLISSCYSKTICKETGLSIWQCHQCDKSSKWKTQIKNHVESIHLSNVLQFSCKFCPHVTHTSAGLKMHTRRNHSNV